MGYSYFDTPDGEDCDKKLAYMLKKGGIIGLAVGTTDVLLMLNPPATYLQALARYARCTTPFLAVAAAGTMSVCMLTDLRKKDDHINYAAGGFIGGLAGGLAAGSFGHGIAAGLFLSFCAAGIKECRKFGVDFVCENPPVTSYEDFWTKDYDWTISKKIPADWVAK